VIATKAELQAWVSAAPIRSTFRLAGRDDRSPISAASVRLGVDTIRNGVAEMRQLRAEMNGLRADLRTSLHQLRKSVEEIHQGIDTRASQTARDRTPASADSSDSPKHRVLFFDTSGRKAS
jgi:hypothetical protein